MTEDIIRLHQPVHILVGTPGRVLDLASTKKLADLSRCHIVAMDEADKLLSTEMLVVIESLCALLSPSRQFLLFSATYPVTVMGFRDKWMKTPHEINLVCYASPNFLIVSPCPFCSLFVCGCPCVDADGRIDLDWCHSILRICGGETENSLPLHFVSQGTCFFFFPSHFSSDCKVLISMHQLQINQSIIFCNSVTRVELLAKKITELGFSCFHIHAKMNQHDRNRVFHDFRNGGCRNLVSSGLLIHKLAFFALVSLFFFLPDLCTRGIDIQAVNVVINFDFPRASETYLHRYIIQYAAIFLNLFICFFLVPFTESEGLVDSVIVV